MKSFLTILLFFPTVLLAQNLTVSQSQLNFGNVQAGDPDSVQITVSNPLATAVNVTGIHFYDFWGEPGYSASESSFSLSAGGSKNIWIKFDPKHNIDHNSELIISNDLGNGTVRIDLVGQGKYDSYYSSTYGLSEQELKDELKSVLGAGFSALSYNAARDAMYMRVDNQKVNGQGAGSNTLETVYTGATFSGYSDRADAQSTYNVNTEHTFPQSLFSSALPMKADLHHLFITQDNANSERANKPFGNVSSATWTQGGSESNSSTFEPRDEHKGRAARSLMYFVIKYQDYTNFFAGQETVLRQWHNSFPPNTVEQNRSLDVQDEQGNRNPFIDYPAFEQRITNFVSNSPQPAANYSLHYPEQEIYYGMGLAPGTNKTYTYNIVNDGNQTITLSNMALNHPYLSFANNSGANITLAPGDGVTIEAALNMTTDDAVVASLGFDTDIPGGSRVHVPVRANTWSATSIAEQSVESLTIFPNPASTEISIQCDACVEEVLLSIYSLGGQLLMQDPHYKAGTLLDVSGLARGTYVVELSSETLKQTRKFLKE